MKCLPHQKYFSDEVAKSLIVGEIYKSVHGEMPNQGKITAVVRLAGCDSGCVYCDTKRFWRSSGRTMSFEKILLLLKRQEVKSVLLTGGEPLEQKFSYEFLRFLINHKFDVTLETNGAYSIVKVPKKVTIVMDLKTPSSKTRKKSMLENLVHLKRNDVLKIVVSNLEDYEWAKKILIRKNRYLKCRVVFSTAYGKLSPKRLVRKMIKDDSPYVMQIQLHKYLGFK